MGVGLLFECVVARDLWSALRFCLVLGQQENRSSRSWGTSHLATWPLYTYVLVYAWRDAGARWAAVTSLSFCAKQNWLGYVAWVCGYHRVGAMIRRDQAVLFGDVAVYYNAATGAVVAKVQVTVVRRSLTEA